MSPQAGPEGNMRAEREGWLRGQKRIKGDWPAQELHA